MFGLFHTYEETNIYLVWVYQSENDIKWKGKEVPSTHNLVKQSLSMANRMVRFWCIILGTNLHHKDEIDLVLRSRCKYVYLKTHLSPQMSIRILLGSCSSCITVNLVLRYCCHFFKWATPGLFFFYFRLFNTIQMTFNNKCSIKICRCLDSNHGPLTSEATALPTEPQPLPLLPVYQVTNSVKVLQVCLCLFINI